MQYNTFQKKSQEKTLERLSKEFETFMESYNPPFGGFLKMLLIDF